MLSMVDQFQTDIADIVSAAVIDRRKGKRTLSDTLSIVNTWLALESLRTFNGVSLL